jgi:hypothetical protein
VYYILTSDVVDGISFTKILQVVVKTTIPIQRVGIVVEQWTLRLKSTEFPATKSAVGGPQPMKALAYN